METFEERLKRFTNENEREIPLTVINSINNFFIPEIHRARENGFYYLIWLGTHAVMQTISEKVFGKPGLEGTRFFLNNFVDGDTADTKFSLIAEHLHEIRNVIAHQWLSAQFHVIVIDDRIKEGWKQDHLEITINSGIYFDHVLAAFERGGRIWRWQDLTSEMDLTKRKYEYIKQWAGLEKKHPISVEIGKVADLITLQEVRKQEEVIKQLIVKEYKLT